MSVHSAALLLRNNTTPQHLQAHFVRHRTYWPVSTCRLRLGNLGRNADGLDVYDTGCSAVNQDVDMKTSFPGVAIVLMAS